MLDSEGIYINHEFGKFASTYAFFINIVSLSLYYRRLMPFGYFSFLFGIVVLRIAGST